MQGLGTVGEQRVGRDAGLTLRRCPVEVNHHSKFIPG